MNIDVFAPGKFGIETGAKFQQCCDTTIGLNATAGRCKCTTDHLPQGRFAAAIAPDNAYGLAFFDFKGNVFQGPEFADILLGVLPG